MSREKTRLFCPGTSDLNGTGKGLKQAKSQSREHELPLREYNAWWSQETLSIYRLDDKMDICG